MTDAGQVETVQKAATPYIAFAPDGHPYLQGSRCDQCGQVYVGKRDNCAKCTARGKMKPVELGTTGRLYNYTIVYRSYPGVKVPFISAIVDLEGGGTVKGNLIDIDPTLDNIAYDMPVSVTFRGAEITNPASVGFTSHFFIPAEGSNSK